MENIECYQSEGNGICCKHPFTQTRKCVCQSSFKVSEIYKIINNYSEVGLERQPSKPDCHYRPTFAKEKTVLKALKI